MKFQLTLTQPGIELVLHALSQMPYAQTAGLIRELESQANAQVQAAQAAEAPAETLKKKNPRQ